MPIPLPNLDDRTYTDLVAEARALIPHVQPEWTNHNPSDPGMALIELLAWLAEMALYQVNIVTDRHTEAFLELLNGPEWTLGEQDLDTAVHQTILALRDQYRAATAADFEYLARHKWPEAATLRRVYCLPRHNLSGGAPTAAAPGHVSLIVIFQPGVTAGQTAVLLTSLWQFLNERRLLTMRHHVVTPTYIPVQVAADLHIREDARPADALRAATAVLTAYFDPLTGGPAGEGWPFGRGVYSSEIYALLNGLDLVDYVEAVQLTGPDNVPQSVEVKLNRHELVTIDGRGLTAVDIYGNRYAG
jgi:hypothetical protein